MERALMTTKAATRVHANMDLLGKIVKHVNVKKIQKLNLTII
jgi:hypothetical protein